MYCGHTPGRPSWPTLGQPPRPTRSDKRRNRASGREGFWSHNRPDEGEFMVVAQETGFEVRVRVYTVFCWNVCAHACVS